MTERITCPGYRTQASGPLGGLMNLGLATEGQLVETEAWGERETLHREPPGRVCGRPWGAGEHS